MMNVWVSSPITVLHSSPIDDECPDASPAHENCEYDEVCEDASCKYNEYVTCHLNRCGTCEAVFHGYDNLTINCNQLTPKCRLMHLEMLHKSKSGQRHPGGGRLDVDNVYDPECERNGTFKAKQCDDDSNLCWCVDSAGVRVTDKTGDDPKCDRLVRVHLIQIDFSFRAEFTFLKGKGEEVRRKVAINLVKQYTLKATQILEITVEEATREVSIKLSENSTRDPVDIATVAYYIERDVSTGLPSPHPYTAALGDILPFKFGSVKYNSIKRYLYSAFYENISKPLKRNKFSLGVDDRMLEVDTDSILVLFFDNEPPRINMKTISPGFAAIIIVIALAILTGIAVFHALTT
nr:PREDICTED: epithelial cell adhesion molecule-like [Latimeria chalumnae]|eukprot:XP_014341971.1 PREDICTED: epithelial cell adhesion molecule-like [Latimeria chalumnae]